MILLKVKMDDRNMLLFFLNKIRYGVRKILYYKNLKSEEEYWKRTEMSICEDGPDYYVIRRKGKVGLFSIYITTIGQIKYALRNGMIPVVDLMNYRNLYMGIESLGKYNPWENLFHHLVCPREHHPDNILFFPQF